MANELRAKPLPWVYVAPLRTLDAAVAEVSVDQSHAGSKGQTPERPHEIQLEGFQSMVEARRGLILDARPKVFYDQAHVPGALSLPRETFADNYKALRTRIEGYKDQLVAVYCSGGDCPDSQLVADALMQLGYRHVVIYTSGWEEWAQTGLPQEGTAVQP